MIDPTRYPLLSRIDSPRDLRALPESELPAVTLYYNATQGPVSQVAMGVMRQVLVLVL